MRRKPALLTLVVAALATLALALPAAPAAAATRCRASFHVLHDDHIGRMSLPAGQYTLRVVGIRCASAARLFAEFLQDYDGHLRYPWRAAPRTRTFIRGNGPVTFSVRRQTYPPTPPRPPTPSNPATCPGTFSVLHNDHIGPLQFPRGAYQLRLLGPDLTCQRAAQLFARFLDHPSGALPAPWTLGAPPGASTGAVFNDLPDGTAFSALRVGSDTGGGGHTPDGGTVCPGSFRVLHNDNIGSLYLPAGRYRITLRAHEPLTCAQASSLLTSFLAAARVPRGWVLDATSASFIRRSDHAGFRIKPVRRNSAL